LRSQHPKIVGYDDEKNSQKQSPLVFPEINIEGFQVTHEVQSYQRALGDD
jgi:hypothetical protein